MYLFLIVLTIAGLVEFLLRFSLFAFLAISIVGLLMYAMCDDVARWNYGMKGLLTPICWEMLQEQIKYA